MLFSNTSSLLVAVLTLGSALVHAQFQGGTFRIQNSEGQTTFLAPGNVLQDGIGVVASTNFPEGSASTWDITLAPVDGNVYFIEDTQFGHAVTGSEDRQLVSTPNSEHWTFKSLPNGFYAIQKSGSDLTWTSVGLEGQDQEIRLEREDPVFSAQRFALIQTDN